MGGGSVVEYFSQVYSLFLSGYGRSKAAIDVLSVHLSLDVTVEALL